jgi:hypothetical protein
MLGPEQGRIAMSDTTQGGQTLTMSGAAFDVFRNRGRSGVLLGATIGYLVILLVLTGLFGWAFWGAIGDYFTWAMQLSGKTDPAQMMMPPQSVMGLIPAYVLFLLCVYIVLAAYEAACLRWLVRGETGGFFLGLGLGADTWRVWFGYWIWFFLILGLYIGVILVTLIVAGILGAVRLDAGVVGLVTFVTVIAGLCVFLWIGVRLAPAAATSVALNRFAFFNAWSVTRGRFWSLFGSFLLLIVLYLVAAIVIFGVGFGLLMGGAFTNIASMGPNPPPEQVFALFAAPHMIIGAIIIYALYLVAVMVFFVALFGVNARAALVAKQEGRIS